MSKFDIDTIVKAYVIAALWSSYDDNENALDANYSIEDIAPATMAAIRNDVARLVSLASLKLEESCLTDAQIGHDFWLTRNRHGAGFWDRGLGNVGDMLTETCKRFKEVNLYIGDDGKVHSDDNETI